MNQPAEQVTGTEHEPQIEERPPQPYLAIACTITDGLASQLVPLLCDDWGTPRNPGVARAVAEYSRETGRSYHIEATRLAVFP